MSEPEPGDQILSLKSLYAAAGLLAIAAVFGCSDVEEPTGTLMMDLPEAQCGTDGECEAEEICVEGLCGISPPVDDVDYGLIVRPPKYSGIPSQVVSLASHPVIDAQVVVEPHSTIAGELQTTDGVDAPDGTLVVTSTGSAQLEESHRPLRDGRFELEAPPGEYELRYIVDDQRWPRIPLGSQELSGDESLELTMPAFSQLRSVTGELTRDALELMGLLAEPIEGAEVVAEATASGNRSQVAMTDEDGRFELYLPPGDDDFDVRVSPSSENQIVPTAVFANEIDADTDDIALSVGELELELLTISVEVSAQELDGHTPDWDGYGISLERPLDIGDLLLRPRLGDDGLVELDVLPGAYDIEIITPPGAPWAGASDSINVIDSLTGVDIELPIRPRVQGTFADEHGEPIAHSRLRTVSVTGSDADAVTTYTDDSGDFEMWLDPGEYEVVVQPSASTGMPIEYRQLTIDPEDTEVTRDIELNRGFVATGRLQSSQGAPLTQTAIEAFDDDGSTIDYGITSKDGTYRVILPSP